MTDFDFDELDKAVAGVLTTETDDDTKKNNDSIAPLVEPSTPEVKTQPTLETIATPVAPVGPPAARRSSGRFMDVVHPSSDMRPRTTFTPPQPSTSTETKPEATQQPIEAPPQQPPEENTTDSSLIDGMSYEDNWDKPLESPFLPDAKVEKRPLGGFGSPNIPLDTLEEQLLLEASDEPLLEAHTMPDPIDFAAHASALASESEDTGETVSTPQELEALVDNAEEPKEVALEPVQETSEEAGESLQLIEPEDTTPHNEADLTPEPEIEEVNKEEAIHHSEPASDPLPVGSGSITQQYTEQPAAEVATGSIYDTETYHQPLPVVVKKRSGAWIFVWILALVIFGAGAGVVFYLFILPMI